MWSTGRRSQRCTPGMPANCPAWTQARPASLCSSAKENGPISPRIPTGLFILLFNNSTKSCQLLTNLSGEELQRSSNLETSLLYAIPMWIGQTAGEKLKKINNFARKRHPSSSPAVKESQVKGQRGRYRYTRVSSYTPKYTGYDLLTFQQPRKHGPYNPDTIQTT